MTAQLMIETPRLLLRLHALEDVPYMMELNSDPEVVRYTGDPSFKDESEAAAVIGRLEKQYTEHRMGRFVVIDRATGEKLGFCGLRWFPDEQVTDLGYRFHRRYWGRGYATESSIASLNYGFDVLGLPRIVAHATAENAASVNVLEKLGFQRTGPAEIGDLPALGFELTRSEWEARRSSFR